MILNDRSIRDRQLVRNATESCYRSASYDLTVGSIVTADGEEVDHHRLGPQEVVKVISAESVEMPVDVTAYVHVKTGLCNEGILALNIGIVDPGFSGPLQSALINFGKTTHKIKRGSVFGRITFHAQMPPERITKVVRSMNDVKDEAKTHVDKYLARDFLNFSKTVKKAAKKATSEYRNTLLFILPLFAFLFAGLTYFLNFSNMSRLEGYINVQDRVTDARRREEMEAKLSELAELQKEISEIKQQMARDSPVDRSTETKRSAPERQ